MKSIDYVLLATQELRVRVPWTTSPPSQHLSLTALKDTGIPADQPQHSKAEIFGSELIAGHKYTFDRGTQLAVFTWHGCTVRVEGMPEWCYVSDVSSMKGIVDMHTSLHNRRVDAQALEHKKGKVTLGPRVLVCGAEGTGKNTIAMIFANYAARSGHPVTLVDTDVEGQIIGCPESIAAAHVTSQIHPEEGFANFPALVHYFGFLDPMRNAPFYAQCLERTADAVQRRMSPILWPDRAKERWGGYVVNAPRLDIENASEVLGHIVRIFDINVVISVGDDNVRHAVKRACLRMNPNQDSHSTSTCVNPNETMMSMYSMDLVHGVCARDRGEEMSARVRRYFRGTVATPVTSISVGMQQGLGFPFVKIGAVTRIQDLGILPIGEESVLDAVSLEFHSDVSDTLHGRIAAVVMVDEDSGISAEEVEVRIKMANAAGFVWIKSVSVVRGEVEVLTAAEELPPAKGTYYLLGEGKYTAV